MKKTYFTLIACFLLFTFHLQAKKIQGAILYEDDTVDVVFKIPLNLLDRSPQYERIQLMIRYIGKEGRLERLRPSENIKEIRINHLGEEIRMISCRNNLSKNILYPSPYIFLKLEMEGSMRLYSFYYTNVTNTGQGTTTTVSRYDVAQKGENGDLTLFRMLIGRKKDITNYFSDCPYIMKGLKAKTLNTRSLWALAELYNKHCG